MTIRLAAAFILGSSIAFADPLPMMAQGSWDISDEACAKPGTSINHVDITADRIDTFGGNAIIKDIQVIGNVTFIAADFLQLEGAAEPQDRYRTYYRLSQRDGPDQMIFVWKDVGTTRLVRCGPTN